MSNEPQSTFADALPAGTSLLGGAFTITKVLAHSNFAITYGARDNTLHRDIALKEYFPAGCRREPQSFVVVPSGTLSGAEFAINRARFVDEALALATFHHAHIVAVHAFFEANNTAYMVMEWLRGRTLAEEVDARGRFGEAEVLSVAEQLCDALTVVHDASLLHRDLKPENILLCGNRVVLVDFGLSTRFHAASNFGTRPLDNALRFGTPGYAPLEQYTQSGTPTPATDVYALGATLYFLVAGQTPPPATDRAFGEELAAPRALNPKVSASTNEAIRWALRMKPEARPQSARAFCDRLLGRDDVLQARVALLKVLLLRLAQLEQQEQRSFPAVPPPVRSSNVTSSTPAAPNQAASSRTTNLQSAAQGTAPLTDDEEVASGCFQAVFVVYFVFWALAAIICAGIFAARWLLFGL